MKLCCEVGKKNWEVKCRIETLHNKNIYIGATIWKFIIIIMNKLTKRSD